MMTTTKRRLSWAWIGVLAGLAVSLGDGAVFIALGLEMKLGTRDPTVLMVGTYVLTIAFLGYVAGSLYEARRDLQESQARTL